VRRGVGRAIEDPWGLGVVYVHAKLRRFVAKLQGGSATGYWVTHRLPQY
jgi:hypothetical protein